jgi:hypothetical protein
MKDVALLALKALNGGLFVVAFALLGEVLVPKRFSGLFSAAPSIALANLLVIVLAKGPADGIANARGMVVGGLAFALSCLAGIPVLRRHGAMRGSLVVCATWLVIALFGYRVLVQ